MLREGSKNRATAATALNAHSSRSHALLSVKVGARGRMNRRFRQMPDNMLVSDQKPQTVILLRAEDCIPPLQVTFTAANGHATTSTIHLVDLAGSERVDKSEVGAGGFSRRLALFGPSLSFPTRPPP